VNFTSPPLARLRWVVATTSSTAEVIAIEAPMPAVELSKFPRAFVRSVAVWSRLHFEVAVTCSSAGAAR